MRILLTRPREDSERLAAKLEAMGHNVLIEPLFTIEPELDQPVDLSGIQALLLTSANGARSFALRSSERNLRVLAVGDATAAAAQEFGFRQVESAGGDVNDLARLVIERLKPEDGALLHASGSVVAGDLAGVLAKSGFTVRRTVLYRAEPVSALSAETTAALRAGRVEAVLFFSPRTASVFVGLATQAGLEAAMANVAMLGLSPAVVAAAAGLPWAAREAAAAPTEASLIEAVERRAAEAAISPRLPQSEGDGSVTEKNEPTRPNRPVEEPIPAPEPKAAPRRERIWVAPAALALALAALGWTAWREFNPPPDPALAAATQATERLETLERDMAARLDRLAHDMQTQLGTVERDLPAQLATAEQARAEAERRAAALGDSIAGLDRRLAETSAALDALAERTARIEQEPRNAADPGRIAGLTAENHRLGQELARLQEEVAALNAGITERGEMRRSDSLALALGQLREALARGAPYDAELATVRAVSAEDQTVLQPLSTIEPHAQNGVPTRAALRDRFGPVAAEIARAGHAPGSDEWWRPAFDRISSLVSVRRVGEVDGESPAAIAARAERRLAADDLPAAVAEIEKLDGAAAEAARAWLDDARARVAADAALRRLYAYALRTTAEPKGAP